MDSFLQAAAHASGGEPWLWTPAVWPREDRQPTHGYDRAKSLIEMAGATGLKPATFGVTGRTKFNGINDSCKFFRG
jgi:hypothetical protein